MSSVEFFVCCMILPSDINVLVCSWLRFILTLCNQKGNRLCIFTATEPAKTVARYFKNVGWTIGRSKFDGRVKILENRHCFNLSNRVENQPLM